MYTTDSESHTLSVTRLLGDEKEQLKKNFTVYISSGSGTDETSFLKFQTHNTIFMLSSTCLAIHADRIENIPISIAQSKLTPTTIKGEKQTKFVYYASVAILHNARVFAGFNCCKQHLHGCKTTTGYIRGSSLATISLAWPDSFRAAAY